MSNNTDMHVFIYKSLDHHDYELVLIVTHIASMTVLQQLYSLTSIGRFELVFDKKTLFKIINTVKNNGSTRDSHRGSIQLINC